MSSKPKKEKIVKRPFLDDDIRYLFHGMLRCGRDDVIGGCLLRNRYNILHEFWRICFNASARAYERSYGFIRPFSQNKEFKGTNGFGKRYLAIQYYDPHIQASVAELHLRTGISVNYIIDFLNSPECWTYIPKKKDVKSFFPKGMSYSPKRWKKRLPPETLQSTMESSEKQQLIVDFTGHVDNVELKQQ